MLANCKRGALSAKEYAKLPNVQCGPKSDSEPSQKTPKPQALKYSKRIQREGIKKRSQNCEIFAEAFLKK